MISCHLRIFEIPIFRTNFRFPRRFENRDSTACFIFSITDNCQGVCLHHFEPITTTSPKTMEPVNNTLPLARTEHPEIIGKALILCYIIFVDFELFMLLFVFVFCFFLSAIAKHLSEEKWNEQSARLFRIIVFSQHPPPPPSSLPGKGFIFTLAHSLSLIYELATFLNWHCPWAQIKMNRSRFSVGCPEQNFPGSIMKPSDGKSLTICWLCVI